VRRLDNIVYFPDFMPTLAAIGAGTPSHNDGMDISPLFFGGSTDTDHRMLYWEFPGKQRAARLGNWKCVTIKKNAPLELYNLKDDPAEQHNLADQYPEMVQLFEQAMQGMRTPSECWPLPGEQKLKINN
jgi:arylsulfatase A-like enzyme